MAGIGQRCRVMAKSVVHDTTPAEAVDPPHRLGPVVVVTTGPQEHLDVVPHIEVPVDFVDQFEAVREALDHRMAGNDRH